MAERRRCPSQGLGTQTVQRMPGGPVAGPIGCAQDGGPLRQCHTSTRMRTASAGHTGHSTANGPHAAITGTNHAYRPRLFSVAASLLARAAAMMLPLVRAILLQVLRGRVLVKGHRACAAAAGTLFAATRPRLPGTLMSTTGPYVRDSSRKRRPPPPPPALREQHQNPTVALAKALLSQEEGIKWSVRLNWMSPP